MKFRTKLLSTNGLMLLFMMVIATIVYSNITILIETSSWVAHTHQVIINSKNLEKYLIDMETGERGFLIAGNEEYLLPYTQGKARFEVLMTETKQMVIDNPEQVKQLVKIDHLVQQWISQAAIPEVSKRRAMNKNKVTIRDVSFLIKQGTGKKILDSLRLEFEEFNRIERALLLAREDDAKIIADQTIFAVIFGTMFAVGLGGVISLFISRSLMRQIGGEPDVIAEASRELARGNVNIFLSESSRAATGIYASLQIMIAAVKAKIDIAEDIAKGKLSRKVTLASEHDSLGKALKNMIESLEGKAQAAQRISEGNFSTEITLASEDDMLGKALKAMAENLNKITVSKASVGRVVYQRTKELIHAHTYIENIISSLHDSLFVLDAQGKITTVNSALLQLLDYEEADIIGEPISTIISELNGKDIFGKVQLITLVETGKAANIDLNFRTKKGSLIPVSIAGAIMSNEEGQFSEIVVTARDMRATKELILKLRHNVEELKLTQTQLIQSAKLAAIGEMVAGFAHEINNPLTAILTCTDMLKEDIDDIPALSNHDKDFYKMLHLIEEGANRCKSIVVNLLSFARQGDNAMTAVGLNNLIDKTIVLLQVQLRRNNLKFILDIETDIPEILGNAGQLQQVLTNLLLNAAQAVEGAGTITICAQKAGPNCEINISDTGDGIPSENLNHIFDPFFTTKPVGRGTGLGLSIVYGIIQKHTGTIHAKSILGQGTTFHIRLPIFKQQKINTT